MHITNALIKTSNNNPVLFTTPGHNQQCLLKENFFLKDVFKYDFSEIEELDNLHNPKGIIEKSQKWASEIYGSGGSFYLINGSSSGLLALMMATTNENDKILVARNAHKSVINALVLTGAYPIWMNTSWIEEFNIPGAIHLDTIKKYYKQNSDVKAVWLTNPTYEGIVTDITPISEFCREKGLFLIVDEAHGALWNFSAQLPKTAIELGADASVQSLHKTASCLNQGAILHLSKNSKISPKKIQQCLNIVNTTSPSYIMLASIEGSIGYMASKDGQNKLNSLLMHIDTFKKQLNNYERLFFLKETDNFNIDKTKIFFGIKNISGHLLSDYIQEKFNIEVEISYNSGLLAITGIGTDENKLDKLSHAVYKAHEYYSLGGNDNSLKHKCIMFQTYPETIYSPREAFYKKSKKILLKDSLGKISKETIVSYPPGIPVLIQGEVIKDFHLELLIEREYLEVIS